MRYDVHCDWNHRTEQPPHAFGTSTTRTKVPDDVYGTLRTFEAVSLDDGDCEKAHLAHVFGALSTIWRWSQHEQ